MLRILDDMLHDIYMISEKINLIFFSISETDNLKSSIHVCIILHVLFCVSQALTLILSLATLSLRLIFYLMYVFIYLLKFG